ncbi:hypothetical protein HA402_006403 [Bradysia odoriphaga]|nr:hypothetical protein HA402_006403 [Bradysia odoriphaga]
MGVLQRFGISYFIVASIHVLVYVEPKDILPEGKLKRALYDIQILAFQWFLILCITAMHVVITFGLIVPDCPLGYLGPGGKQDNATNPNCIGGATGYVDELILGSKHIYRWPTAGSVYDASAFDPEGMVGCLTTFLQVFIGLQCGVTLLVYTDWKDRVARLLIWGIVLGVIGGSLCLFSQEGGVIPINKNLWSLSFVFVTCALAYLLLTLFYILVDVLNWWSGTPLVYAGMNAILLYVGHSVIGSMFPWRWSIGPMNTHLVLLVENMWHAGMWVVVSYFFYCKKVFISV